MYTNEHDKTNYTFKLYLKYNNTFLLLSMVIGTGTLKL